MRVDDLLDDNQFPDFFDHCFDCIELESSDPLFLDQSMLDFRLDTSSIAQDQAIPIPSIQFDIIGELRDMVTPDMGCYELR